MKHVSADLKARVNARIEQCRALVQAAFPQHTIPTPEIRYDINSANLGGQAFGDRYIRLNPVFLNSDTDHYIHQTVGHEFAHIATQAVFGDRGVSSHGPQWQRVMGIIGIPANRCHNYEVPEGVKVGKPKQKYAYECINCKHPMLIGPSVHKKIQNGASFWHKDCGRYVGGLVLMGTVGRLNHGDAIKKMEAIKQAKAAPTPVAVNPGLTVAVPKTTKLHQCQEIYAAHRHTHTKAQVIEMFIARAACTPSGANTYYHTLSKKG